MPKDTRPYLMAALILLQAISAAFFISDIVTDSFLPTGAFNYSRHLMVESGATLGLVFGIFFEARYMLDLLRRNQMMEQKMRVATGALNDVIQEYFVEWGLTPSERDVALFAIKGMSNAEIAALRNSSEGTIKAHLNAVFRKAGVSGRNQLVSLLIEDLMNDSLISNN